MRRSRWASARSAGWSASRGSRRRRRPGSARITRGRSSTSPPPEAHAVRGRSRTPARIRLGRGGCLAALSMWRDFPAKLCAAVGLRGLVYSRYGYGKSDPLRDWKNEPRRVDFMHDEALHALPELLDALAVPAPVILGHSDGGSIAL